MWLDHENIIFQIFKRMFVEGRTGGRERERGKVREREGARGGNLLNRNFAKVKTNSPLPNADILHEAAADRKRVRRRRYNGRSEKNIQGNDFFSL